MGKLQIIVGGMAGSEGKGHIAAQLAMPERNPAGVSAVRVAGPNAGHSAVDSAGQRWPLRQIPVAAVVNPDARLYIAAGSEIDIPVLLAEIEGLEAGGHKIRERLTIDQMATILEPRHHEAEAAAGIVGRIGSTGKGIGAARADRIMRRALTVRDTDLHDLCAIGNTADRLRQDLAAGVACQIEGTQGHWLGLHHPFYPSVTSSDCRAIDFAAMAGINPWDSAVTEFEVWVVFRTRPIRVAGPSGPLPAETSWDALGLPPEYTTVTGKLRRVGEWDAELAAAAVRANGGAPVVRLALTMLDQPFPELAGATDAHQLTDAAIEFIHGVQRDTGSAVRLLGTSDRTMIEL
jgi:adenylosuccinate synthase